MTLPAVSNLYLGQHVSINSATTDVNMGNYDVKEVNSLEFTTNLSMTSTNTDSTKTVSIASSLVQVGSTNIPTLNFNTNDGNVIFEAETVDFGFADLSQIKSVKFSDTIEIENSSGTAKITSDLNSLNLISPGIINVGDIIITSSDSTVNCHDYTLSNVNAGTNDKDAVTVEQLAATNALLQALLNNLFGMGTYQIGRDIFIPGNANIIPVNRVSPATLTTANWQTKYNTLIT